MSSISNLSFRFKQRRPQAGARGRQPLGKLRADAGGAEDAANLAALVDAGAVES